MVNEKKAGVILGFASMVLFSVVSIIYTPVQLRMLGQSEYGIIGLSNSVTGYLSLLTFGLSASFIRNNARYREKGDKIGEHRLNGMYFAVYCVIAVFILICGAVLVFNVDSMFGKELTAAELFKTKVIMALTVVSMAINLPFHVYNINIVAYERFIFSRMVIIINTLLLPLITVPLLFLGIRSVGVVIVSLSITMFNLIINIIYARKKVGVKICFDKIDSSIIKGIFAFSSVIFLNSVIDQVNWNFDKFLLGMFKGAAPVAVYALGAQFNSYYLNVAMAVTSVFVPQINWLVAKDYHNTDLPVIFNRVGRIQFVLLFFIFLGFVIFGKPFIIMWVGKDYVDAYYIGLILLGAITVPLIQGIGLEIQRAKNKHRFCAVVLFFMAIVNILISIPLCRQYGGIGAALGTGFALLAGNGLIVNIYYHKRLELDVLGFWKGILKFLPALFLPILLGIMIYMFIDLGSIPWFVLSALIYAIVYAASMWRLGLNEYEKKLVKTVLNKILGR